MSDVNYTGQILPVLSFSDLDLSEKQFLKMYRENQHIRDLSTQYLQSRDKLADAIRALKANGGVK